MLKVGKKADLIIVDMKKPHPYTLLLIFLPHLVYSAKGSDVRTTIVNGKVLMDDYRVLTLGRAKSDGRSSKSRRRAYSKGKRLKIFLMIEIIHIKKFSTVEPKQLKGKHLCLS